MKPLDEKGRLFGRVNLIDAIVLAALAGVLIFVVVGLLGRGGGSGLGGGGGTPMTYTVRVNSLDRDICTALRRFVDEDSGKRDQLMSLGDMLDGYVVAMRVMPRANYAPDETGLVTVTEETGDGARVDVIFTIQVNVWNAITNEVGNQEVRTGKPHTVRTKHFELLGTILSIHAG